MKRVDETVVCKGRGVLPAVEDSETSSEWDDSPVSTARCILYTSLPKKGNTESSQIRSFYKTSRTRPNTTGKRSKGEARTILVLVLIWSANQVTIAMKVSERDVVGM